MEEEILLKKDNDEIELIVEGNEIKWVFVYFVWFYGMIFNCM